MGEGSEGARAREESGEGGWLRHTISILWATDYNYAVAAVLYPSPSLSLLSFFLKWSQWTKAQIALTLQAPPKKEEKQSIYQKKNTAKFAYKFESSKEEKQ